MPDYQVHSSAIADQGRFGERLPLPLVGDAEALCPHTGERYVLSAGVLRLASG
jgi:UDP-2-acetamido-3-amino-2,3-dideoxy-glucuronate N-acetyltransferase